MNQCLDEGGVACDGINKQSTCFTDAGSADSSAVQTQVVDQRNGHASLTYLIDDMGSAIFHWVWRKGRWKCISITSRVRWNLMRNLLRLTTEKHFQNLCEVEMHLSAVVIVKWVVPSFVIKLWCYNDAFNWTRIPWAVRLSWFKNAYLRDSGTAKAQSAHLLRTGLL